MNLIEVCKVKLCCKVISVHFTFPNFPVEDGDAIDPCILSTLRKLEDGYFAGARFVSSRMQ